jgi:hypothetical protein
MAWLAGKPIGQDYRPGEAMPLPGVPGGTDAKRSIGEMLQTRLLPRRGVGRSFLVVLGRTATVSA